MDSIFRSCLCSIRRLTGAHIYLSVWSGSQGLWSYTWSHTCFSTPTHADVYHTHDLTGPGMLFVITEGHSILAMKKAERIKFYIALGISLNVFEVMVCCRLCNGYLISRSLVQNMTCRNIKMLMLQQSLWKNISEKNVIIMWDNIINPIYVKPDFFIYLITLMYSLMSLLLFVFIKLITLLLFFIINLPICKIDLFCFFNYFYKHNIWEILKPTLRSYATLQTWKHQFSIKFKAFNKVQDSYCWTLQE